MRKGLLLLVAIMLGILLIPAKQNHQEKQYQAMEDQFYAQHENKMQRRIEAVLATLAEIEFENPNLEKCVRAAAKKHAQLSSNYIRHIDQLTQLSCWRRNIDSLEGLQHLTGLRHLDVSQNQIEDLRPIARLPNLTSLKVSDNAISSVYPLKDHPTLTTLDVQKNPIEDLHYLSSIGRASDY